MGQPIPAQHPSAVLRSHSNLVRALLIIAMAALLACAAAVVILANDEDEISTATQATPHGQVQPQLPAGTRFDGGPDEGTRGLSAQRQLPVGVRFDGTPTRARAARRPTTSSPNQRSSYQPAPADSFKDRAGGPTMIPQGPAGNESSSSSPAETGPLRRARRRSPFSEVGRPGLEPGTDGL